MGHLKLKLGFKLMMIGSLEEDIVEVTATPMDLPEVVNDLDTENEEMVIENQEVHLAKVQKTIKDYEDKMLSKSGRRRSCWFWILTLRFSIIALRLNKGRN